MKRLAYIIIGVTSLFCSCGDLDEAERFTYVKPADVSRRVLIEDFTGQDCVNCPKATDEIYKIQELYGEENVIAVAIHGGPLARWTNARYEGFRTDLCDEYYNAANVQSNPAGRIDRIGSPANYDTWQSKVDNRIGQVASLSLSLENTYNEADGTVSVNVTATGTNGNTNGHLQLWITEDAIIGLQRMPDGTANKEYTHNHVLRDAVNGTWGTAFSIKEGDTKTETFKAVIDSKWKAGNCSIVAFVYDSNGVQQVAKAAVVGSEE